MLSDSGPSKNEGKMLMMLILISPRAVPRTRTRTRTRTRPSISYELEIKQPLRRLNDDPPSLPIDLPNDALRERHEMQSPGIALHLEQVIRRRLEDLADDADAVTCDGFDDASEQLVIKELIRLERWQITD